MSNDVLTTIFRQVNEAITAATVIVAASMLLYNLTHGVKDRVARSSSVLLACVTIIYVSNVFVALGKTPGSIETWLRVKWIGIAFAPAALFHLSDALLATTGRISRGRRRRVTRLLYLYGIVFLLTAAFTNLIVRDVLLQPVPMMQAGPLFVMYIIYFVAATAFAFNNVVRARRRCLTTATHRRMTYLLLALITPAAGIFPYTLLFSHPSMDESGWLWLLINVGNLGIILMLAFMAYPLSFFGPNKPDRVIKAELLNYMLRGPILGIIVLLVILFVPKLDTFGFPGTQFTPFMAVATVLFWQWMFTIGIPPLERRLIYTEDQEQAQRIQNLSEHLLTTADARQLLEATLAAICDYLRVPSAFVASAAAGGFRLEQSIGSLLPPPSSLAGLEFPALLKAADATGNGTLDGTNHVDTLTDTAQIMAWQSFWLIPLRSTRLNGNQGRVIGVMGIWARSPQPDLVPEEEAIFKALYTRTAQILDDMRLQAEVFEKLEDVLEETATVRPTNDAMRFGNKSELARLSQPVAQSSVVAEPAFADLIKKALTDLWGGPHLTDEQLLTLKIVTDAVTENDGNSARAVRAVLVKAIERLKPEGQRSMTQPQWTLYNILDLRFVQGRKVRDVYTQVALSEADFYRKQRTAVNQVAAVVAEMERHAAQSVDSGPTLSAKQANPVRS